MRVLAQFLVLLSAVLGIISAYPQNSWYSQTLKYQKPTMLSMSLPPQQQQQPQSMMVQQPQPVMTQQQFQQPIMMQQPQQRMVQQPQPVMVQQQPQVQQYGQQSTYGSVNQQPQVQQYGQQSTYGSLNQQPQVQQYGQQPAYGSVSQQPQDPCSTRPCLNEGVCTPNGNSFTCSCPWGWAGSRCEICTTECATNPCPSNKRCKAKFGGGYECVCPPDRAGPNCELLNDVCSNNPCQNGGTCNSVEGGSYVCVCNKPYSGTYCETVWQNPCTESTLRNSEVALHAYPWDKNSYLICVDVNKYHSMPCSVGTYFNKNLRHCVPEGYDPPACPSQYCSNDGECLVDENNLLKCVCKKGFSGDRCEVNVDECLIEGNSKCAGGTCVDQVNGYYCKCANGHVGLNCQETIQNPCSAHNLESDSYYHEVPTQYYNTYLHCTGENSFTVNRCADNLYWNQEEKTCTVNKPATRYGVCLAAPCKNGGQCQETGSSGFTCSCKPGYTGVTCEQMIDYCLSNPCQHGGRCLSYAGGYTCVCSDKIIDDCCCHGVTNPCPPKSQLVPGVNNYYPHLFSNKYIHCDFDRRAFVRACAPGTKWNQGVLSCLPDNFVLNNTNSYDTVNSYGVQAYGYNQNRAQQAPAQQQVPQYGQPAPPVSSYGQQQQYSAPAQVEQPAQQYQVPETTTTKASYVQPSYGNQYQAPETTTTQASYVQPSYGNQYQAPETTTTQASYVQPSYGNQYQAPETTTTQASYVQPSYGQQQQYSAPAQVEQPAQQYSQPAAPVSSYGQQQQYSAPAQVEQPAQQYSQPAAPVSSYGQQQQYSAPAQVEQPAQQYSQPAAPVSSYGQQQQYSAPAQVEQPAQQYSQPAAPVSSYGQQQNSYQPVRTYQLPAVNQEQAPRSLAPLASNTVQQSIPQQQPMPQQPMPQQPMQQPMQQAMPQQALPQQAMPQQAMPQQAMPQQAMPQQAMPQQAMPQQAMPQQPMPQQPMPQQAMPQQQEQVQLTPQQIRQLIQAGVKLPESMMRLANEQSKPLANRRYFGYF